VEENSASKEAPQKIYRSRTQRLMGGVCGGMAEYFNIDVLLVRLAWIIGTLFAGAGIIGYIACLILIPENTDQEIPEKSKRKPGEGAKFWGIVLIILGAVFLIQETGILHRLNFWHIEWQAIFALAFIALGIYIIFNRTKQDSDSIDDKENVKKHTTEKTFYRIEEGKMLSGVCTGLASYFDIDVTLIRLLWVFLTITSGGLGIVAYIVAIIVLPSVPNENHFETVGEKQ